jgi:hypothetical protein
VSRLATFGSSAWLIVTDTPSWFQSVSLRRVVITLAPGQLDAGGVPAAGTAGSSLMSATSRGPRPQTFVVGVPSGGPI